MNIPYRKILLFWCEWPGIPKVPKVTKFQNLGKKEARHLMVKNLTFCAKIRIKVFLKQISSFLVAIIR